MTGKFYTGINGALFVDGAKIAKVRNWSINGSVDSLETTNTGDEARTFVYGRQGYQGQCTALYYEDSSGALAMSSLLTNIYRTSGTSPTATNLLELYLADRRKIKANVLFTSAQTAAIQGEVVSVNLDFVVSGHLVFASFGAA